jgi:ClpP class serine protease
LRHPGLGWIHFGFKPQTAAELAVFLSQNAQVNALADEIGRSHDLAGPKH